MPDLFQNLRYGLRVLRKSPGFTAVAVVTLALGIGATTAIFSVVYAALIAPLPYPKSDQLVMVWSNIRGQRNVVAAADFLDWKRQNTVFQDLNAWTGATYNLATADRPEQVQAQMTTAGFYTMMGVKFAKGRDFTAEESQPGKDHEVILVNRLWKRLGARPDIVGQQLRINGEPYTVIGVMAPGPTDRLSTELVVPLSFRPEVINHDFHWLLVMGRLKDDVTMKQAQAEMGVVTGRIAKDHPQSNTGWSTSVEPLKDDFLPPERIRNLWLLMGAVGFVLLIACANVANLLLAKGTTRLKEVAVRASLGASRRRVFAQFLTESLALSALGGIAGVLLALGMIKALLVLMPPFDLPSEADVHISLPVLLFTLGATVVAGVLFGCVPAWQASAVNLNETLKEGGRSGGGSVRHYVLRVLVITEFGLALTLLASAGLALHSFFNLSRVDLGIRTDHILTFDFPNTDKRLEQPGQIISSYHQLLEKLTAIPGVTSASLSTGMPVQGTYFGMPFNIAGQPQAAAADRNGAGFQMVTSSYFNTFGIQVERGRAFNEQDSAQSPRVAMVNQNFVRRFLAGKDPLGQRVIVEQLIPGVDKLGPPLEWEIVGVFQNVRGGNLRNSDRAEIDVPFDQSPWPQASFAVRTAGDPLEMSKSIAAVIRSVEPDVALANLKSMDQVVDDTLVADRFLALLYGTFATVGLLLAAVGIYGVMTFSVAQRTHEIGLRMALGAAREQVLALILKEGLALALIGVGLGLIGAGLVGRAMRGMLYGVGTFDVSAFAGVAVILFGAALLACYVPAQRATKVDPMVALRYQ
ncbi:MAG TPA: ABC transporter permease [Terriglobales bacterium]|nr:ABC transporter permease [Terriglobales bacterium]